MYIKIAPKIKTDLSFKYKIAANALFQNCFAYNTSPKDTTAIVETYEQVKASKHSLDE